MEFNLFLWAIASLPIFLLLFLMSYMKIKSCNAAFFSLIITSIFASIIYQLNINQLIISTGKGASLSLYVILIILGAVLLYSIVDIAGGFETIKNFIKELGGNRALLFIGLSWAFSGFIQGVTGFGVPVAIAGALIIGIGYKPLPSVIAVLVGHSWSVSFGSIGSSYYTIQLVTGLDPYRLGIIMSLLFIVTIFSTGIFTAHIYGGWKVVKENIKDILLMTVLMSLAKVGAAIGGFAHIATLLAGTIGSIYFMIILIKNSKLNLKEAFFYETNQMTILTALAPYLILIGSILTFQLSPLSNFLPDYNLSFSFPGFTTGLGHQVASEPAYATIELFNHPVFYLLLSSSLGIIIYIFKGNLNKIKLKNIFAVTYKKGHSTAITLLILMIMSTIMNDSGMIFNFARGMARVSGNVFPLFSPLIGILGAFLTGSNTSSNVLFGAFQVNTANLINFSPDIIASTQSIGGSLGSAIAPAKILLGTSVVGITGKEGEIIKSCIKYTIFNALLVGLVALLAGQFL